ncbi:hypothetical protein Patl1_04889 [Pistacia atlantica]|uniref:Uncharacterized protein n=1 Tax=Pistacia atlantica TaxID=434234 RepID=A0ACC1BRT2_9ROSI|nr:hypothetical protein Patl1_04889 [Pistacia atlantica]
MFSSHLSPPLNIAINCSFLPTIPSNINPSSCSLEVDLTLSKFSKDSKCSQSVASLPTIPSNINPSSCSFEVDLTMSKFSKDPKHSQSTATNTHPMLTRAKTTAIASAKPSTEVDHSTACLITKNEGFVPMVAPAVHQVSSVCNLVKFFVSRVKSIAICDLVKFGVAVIGCDMVKFCSCNVL